MTQKVKIFVSRTADPISTKLDIFGRFGVLNVNDNAISLCHYMYYFPLEKTWFFVHKDLNFLDQWKICAKFGWIKLVGSKEEKDKNAKSIHMQTERHTTTTDNRWLERLNLAFRSGNLETADVIPY